MNDYFRVDSGSPLEKFDMDYRQLIRLCEQGQLSYTNKDPVDSNCYSYENGYRDSTSVAMQDDEDGSDDELIGEYYGVSNNDGENVNGQDRPGIKLKINLGQSPKKVNDGKYSFTMFHFNYLNKNI